MIALTVKHARNCAHWNATARLISTWLRWTCDHNVGALHCINPTPSSMKAAYNPFQRLRWANSAILHMVALNGAHETGRVALPPREDVSMNLGLLRASSLPCHFQILRPRTKNMQAYVVLLYFTVYYFTLLWVKVVTHTMLYYAILSMV